MVNLKLIFRYISWIFYVILTTVMFNILLNMGALDNKLLGLILFVMLLVPASFCLWICNLRGRYASLGDVANEFKLARSVTKPLVIALMISQFFFHGICVASVYHPYADTVTKYPNSEKFLIEDFGADVGTLDMLKVLPKQVIDYVLSTGEIMNEVVLTAQKGNVDNPTVDNLIAKYDSQSKTFKSSCLITLFWCCFTAFIYTATNRVALYHLCIKDVKENKNNGSKRFKR